MREIKVALLIILVAALLSACGGSQDKVEDSESSDASSETTSSQETSETTESLDESGAQTSSGPDAGQQDAGQSSEAAALPTEQVLPPATDEQMEIMPKPTEEIVVEAADGLQLVGTFYPGLAPEPTPGVILLHMNGGNRFDWEVFARGLVELGYTALAVDMRGHGETGDQRGWVQTEDDLLRIYDYFTNRQEVDGSRTGFVGASIGANMSLVTGANVPEIAGVVLLSPGRDYFGVTTEDRVLDYGARPLLLVASEEDTESAITARSLSELALGDVTLEMYDGAGHGTNMFGPRPELNELITGWLDQHVGHIDRSESPVQAPDLPTPSLFDVSWDDRSMYREGLISSEVGVLDQLPDAPVYHMDLAISPDQLTVAGRMETLYTNQENTDLNEVFFHLFPNILGGHSSVSALTVNGHRREPEFQLNQSVLRVPLGTPLAPGDQAVIAMEFLVDVPSEAGSNYGVFATIDEILALAHFFPQIAVFDDQGWNFDYPPPNADVTYADTSLYLVRVTAPEEQVLVTSGVEVDREEMGGDQIVTIAAGPVRDFYLASNKDYEAISRQVGETTINSYGFAEYQEHNELALRYAADAMESFNARFGAYPYTEFDIAPTPNQALAVEYPGAVVVRSALYNPSAALGDLPATVYLEGSVAHEVGHQWFYNVVGNDQINEPWVDESLTQHLTYLYFVDTYGEDNAQGFHESFYGRWDRVDLADIPIGMPAGDYTGSEYGAIVYGRGPLFFDALKTEMGDQLFDDFLREYYQQNKWGIATGRSLKALAEDHCGCDLTPLFDEWVGALQ